MEILNYIFEIGVILAIYNFLWWLINLGLGLLRGGRKKQMLEVYIIKAVRYTFLADVIFLFSIHKSEGIMNINDVLIAALVLLIYFVGKIQKKQKHHSLFSIQMRGNVGEFNNFMDKMKPIFDIRYESLVVVLAMGLFVLLYFFPDLANNTISEWFLNNIMGIEQAPVFGFIFKVIGFFFVLSVVVKVVNGLLTVVIGGNNGRRFTPHDDNDEENDNSKF